MLSIELLVPRRSAVHDNEEGIHSRFRSAFRRLTDKPGGKGEVALILYLVNKDRDRAYR